MSAAAPLRRNPTKSKSQLGALASGVLVAVSATGMSAQSKQLEQRLYDFVAHRADAASRPARHQHEKFFLLAAQWRTETRFCSSTTQLAMHPAYQAIIGMGWPVLPLILEELRKDPAPWFWALKAISGEDPVRPADRGAVLRMRDSWLRWGEAKQLIFPR